MQSIILLTIKEIRIYIYLTFRNLRIINFAPDILFSILPKELICSRKVYSTSNEKKATVAVLSPDPKIRILYRVVFAGAARV
jgi:hypothetical protein